MSLNLQETIRSSCFSILEKTSKSACKKLLIENNEKFAFSCCLNPI